tara:strand:- start:589 stop:771 length:183 start_codon:yes stop_codon:yes gene_type:complete
MNKTRCWEDWHSTLTEEEELENIMEMSKTCLLEAGHKGPHKWTRDDQFGIAFNKERNKNQ